MLDSQHRLDLGQNRRDASFDRGTFFRRALYHMEMIELRPLLRNAIATLFAVVAVGCHTTKNVNLVENPDATSRPSRIEVLTRSGASVTVYAPVIQRDSVRGFSDETKTTPVTLAVNDIQSARSRQVSGGRTALLVFGIVAAVVGTLFVLAVIAFSDAAY